MSVKQYFHGSIGPLFYDDEDFYQDGEAQRPFYAPGLAPLFGNVELEELSGDSRMLKAGADRKLAEVDDFSEFFEEGTDIDVQTAPDGKVSIGYSGNRQGQSGIGVITEDLDGTYTQIPVRLNSPMLSFAEYFINDSKDTESISVYPTETKGPGEVTIGIEDQQIEASEGSTITVSPQFQNIKNIQFPDIDFVDETLEVAGRTLKANMDRIANGANFAKVIANAVDQNGFIFLSEALGDLDNIDDGSQYGKVFKDGLGVGGTILLAAAEGDLDDLDDGSTYGKVNAVMLTTTGLVFLEQTVGDIDDVDDGSVYGRVNISSLDASGLVFVSALVGDLDDLDDGTNFQRVDSTQLDAQGLVILSAVQGDLDDLADGTNFAKVNITSVDAQGVVVLSGASGDLDDIQDGTNFAKVDASSLTAGGLVVVSGLSGDIDDLQDGGTYGKVRLTDISAGHIFIIGPDGQTIIEDGEILTNEIFASVITATSRIIMGVGSEISDVNRNFQILSDGGIHLDESGAAFDPTLALTFGGTSASNPDAYLQLRPWLDTLVELIIQSDSGIVFSAPTRMTFVGSEVEMKEGLNVSGGSAIVPTSTTSGHALNPAAADTLYAKAISASSGTIGGSATHTIRLEVDGTQYDINAVVA